MRLLGILLTLITAGCAAFTTLAQTNSAENRSMSLEDCIEIALHHNLDVQIKRYNPEIAAFNLGGLYGGYEPNLNLSAERDDNQQPGCFDSQGRPIPGAEIKTDRYSGGFSGLLLWGLNYNLGINLSDQTTMRGGSPATSSSTVTNVFFVPAWGSNVTFVSTIPGSPGNPGFSTESFSGDAGFLTLRQPLLKNFWIDNTRLQIFL